MGVISAGQWLFWMGRRDVSLVTCLGGQAGPAAGIKCFLPRAKRRC